jgi:hypothetical protein
MEVFVQDQLGVVPEILRRPTQQDPSASRRGSRAHVQTRIERVFDHTHMLDRLAEDFAESGGNVCRDGTAMAWQCVFLSDSSSASI